MPMASQLCLWFTLQFLTHGYLTINSVIWDLHIWNVVIHELLRKDVVSRPAQLIQLLNIEFACGWTMALYRQCTKQHFSCCNIQCFCVINVTHWGVCSKSLFGNVYNSQTSTDVRNLGAKQLIGDPDDGINFNKSIYLIRNVLPFLEHSCTVNLAFNVKLIIALKYADKPEGKFSSHSQKR